MAIHLTRIYTRVGDNGTTATGAGDRVLKTDTRIVAYADTDETNATIGVAVAMGGLRGEVIDVLRQIQNDLFDVGADLCVPLRTGDDGRLRISDAYVARLESWCDSFNDRLPALTSFILPGGGAGAALLHQARTVARRAERSVWELVNRDPADTSAACARYLNRLSDLLFILARVAADGADTLWQPGGPATVAEDA